MLGIFDNVIRAATRRDQWDAPSRWRNERRHHARPDRHEIEAERAALRRELLARGR